MKHLVFAFVVIGCGPPPEPLTIPPAPPDPSGYTCETAEAHLRDLGGCGVDLSGFVALCHDAQDVGHRDDMPLPVGCLSTAADCATERACR